MGVKARPPSQNRKRTGKTQKRAFHRAKTSESRNFNRQKSVSRKERETFGGIGKKGRRVWRKWSGREKRSSRKKKKKKKKKKKDAETKKSKPAKNLGGEATEGGQRVVGRKPRQEKQENARELENCPEQWMKKYR